MDIPKNLRCPSCGHYYEANLTADAVKCPDCGHQLSRIDQMGELLEMWFYPRRWQRAIERPRSRLIIERLWQQQFEPHNMFESLGPADTNFEVFCYTITTVIIKGIEAGWAKLEFPDNPLIDDPIYKLQILNQESFTEAMEQALPDVKWDEDIEVASESVAPAASAAEPETATEPQTPEAK